MRRPGWRRRGRGQRRRTARRRLERKKRIDRNCGRGRRMRRRGLADVGLGPPRRRWRHRRRRCGGGGGGIIVHVHYSDHRAIRGIATAPLSALYAGGPCPRGRSAQRLLFAVGGGHFFNPPPPPPPSVRLPISPVRGTVLVGERRRIASTALRDGDTTN